MRILRYNLEVPDNYTISSDISLSDDSNLSNPGIIVTAKAGSPSMEAGEQPRPPWG